MSNSVSLTENIETDDQILNYTHQKRKSIVEHLTVNGKISNDPDQVKLLLTALKDMDSQAISKKRIKAEEKANDNHAASAELIAKVLMATNNQKSLTLISGIIPTLPSHIPNPTLVEDETSIFVEPETYDTFISKFISD